MAAEDWIPDFGDPEDLEEPYISPFKTCRKCGKEGLIFGKRGSKWVLEESSGRKHTCKVKDVRRKMFSDDD